MSLRRISTLLAILIGSAAALVPPAEAAQLGKIVNIAVKDQRVEVATADGAVTRIIFYRPDIFRIWVGPGGAFSDPAGGEPTPIVVYDGPQVLPGCLPAVLPVHRKQLGRPGHSLGDPGLGGFAALYDHVDGG